MSFPRIGRRLNLLLASGYGVISYYGSTKGLEKRVRKLELQENGESIPVPSKIQDLITEVLNAMNLREEHKFNIKPFLIRTIDLKHFGCPNEGAGAFLGIPQYYLFNQLSDIKFSVVIVNNEVLKNVPATNFLKNAVLLSEEAKKFGIAREIYESLNEDVKLTAALPLMVMLNFNFLSYLLGKLFKRISYSCHILISMMGVFTYALVSDIRSCYIEALSDFHASALGKTYIQGGIEYYEKMIQRNKFLKSINKNAPISADGDINTSSFRTYHMPLKRRIIYLRDLRKQKLKNVTPWHYVFYAN